MDLSNRNVIHIKKGDTEFLQFRKLLEYKDVINHAYSLGTKLNFRTSTINKEKLPEQEYEAAIKSYKEICSSINCNYINLVKTNQEHTNCVKIVEKKIKTAEPDFNLEKYYKTDGLITNKKNIILSTTNADCILLLFFDPVKKVIANTHSGWKGTIQRIAVKTVEKMIKEFECNPKDIICCICPSIRKCHFEVEKDVKDMFENEFKDLENLRNKLNTKIKNSSLTKDTANFSSNSVEKLNVEDLKPNTEVFVKTLGQNGIIVSHISKSNEVQVKVGIIKMNVHINNIEKAHVDKTKKSDKQIQTSGYTSISKSKTVKSEINVIGLNVEEAVFVVDKFLDDCCLAKLQTVRIVHGKGTGKLKTGIHNFLKTNPHVKSYRMGTYGEGEMGVTVVELK